MYMSMLPLLLDAATADLAGRISLGMFFAETNGNQNIGNARSDKYKGSLQTGVAEDQKGRAAWAGAEQVASVRRALAATGGANASSALSSAVATLRIAIDSAVGPASSDAARRGGAARPTFQGVSETMASLLNAQDNADLAPTPPMLAAFTSACRDVSAVQGAWRRVIGRELAVANATFVRLGATPVSPPPVLPVPRC